MRWMKLFLLLFAFANAFAQGEKPAFWDDIQKFKKEDSLHAPPKHAVLFVGSSSFTKWTDVQEYFPGVPIINRGFGGSTLPDVIRYFNDVVTKYKPRQVVIYCGENDIANDSTVTAKMVYKRFLVLYQMIRKNLGNVPVVYISLKPSPSRWQLRSKMMETNKLIQSFVKTQHGKAVFVNVWPAMLEAGKPRPDIFIEDNLHMNAKGYAIWKRLLEPVLKKN